MFGARMSATGLIRRSKERTDQPKKHSGGNEAMIANITATLCQPAAGFGVFAQPR